MKSIAIALALLVASLAVQPAHAAPDAHWVTAWAASPDQAGPSLEAQTLRQIVRVSVGGASIRVRLSNLFGEGPITIGPAHVAVRATGSSIPPGTDHALTFSGKAAVTIAKGESVLSDAVSMDVKALEELAVSLYFPTRTGPSTMHGAGIQTAYLTVSGDATAAAQFPAGEVASSRFFLTDVEVAGAATAATLVALGDSITDGVGSATDANLRWPDQLAARLQGAPGISSIGIANEGIAGNRIVNDGARPFSGPSAQARFDRDVLSKPNVRWIVLLEGINDFAASNMLTAPKEHVSTEQVIAGMKALIARAHAKGVKIWGGTLLPFAGTEWPFHSAAGETKRQALNAWIRTSGAFDAVVDFDAALRDPAHPDQLLPLYDCGDHVHPSDEGHKALAAAIDLKLLAENR